MPIFGGLALCVTECPECNSSTRLCAVQNVDVRRSAISVHNYHCCEKRCCEKYDSILRYCSGFRIDMPFGICAKASEDDLTKTISVHVEIPDKSCIEVTLSRDALGLECLESVASELGLEEVRFTALDVSYENNFLAFWALFACVKYSVARAVI